MAIYRVYSGATGAANGTSWTDAYTTFAAGLAAATTAGDEVWLASDHNEQLTVDTTFSIPAAHTHQNPLKIYSVSRADDTLAVGALIGHSTLNRSITIDGQATALWMYGVTLRIAGSANDLLVLANSNAQSATYEACTFDITNTNVGVRIQTGVGARLTTLKTIGCTFNWGNASQGIVAYSEWDSVGDNLSGGSVQITLLFAASTSSGGRIVTIIGGDLSNISTLVDVETGTGGGASIFHLHQCKMKSGVSLLSVTALGNDRTHVYLNDCSDGDVHYQFAYANDRGTLLLDTGVYANDAITQSPLSWKLTTNAYASYAKPFVTPWIAKYHDGTAAIAPYLECLRSGSTTAYRDNEVWAETTAKVTTGSTRASFYSDRMAPRSTAADQASSSKTASDWTGEHATSNWFGRLGQSSLTPAEAGELCMRVCVGAPSVTVYVDPQVRV